MISVAHDGPQAFPKTRRRPTMSLAATEETPIETRRKSQLSLTKGEDVFREGERGDEMYFVESGRVVIWKGEGNDRKILGTVERGQIFGEMVLLDEKPRMASASALDDVVLRVIRRENLEKRIGDLDPFMKLFVTNLVTKIRSLGEYVDVLTGELERRS